MARMSIYIPDELKERMDRIVREPNRRGKWSAIAQRAFELELQSKNIGDGSMDAVIERLRASKEKTEEETRPHWKALGRQWAQQQAEYDELERVGSIDPDIYDDGGDEAAHGLLTEIVAKVHDDDIGRHETQSFIEEQTGEHKHPSYAQWCFWLEGAQDVWEEVKDQI